jgi:folylpolyglutamate synthase/dihydropteroate synthase
VTKSIHPRAFEPEKLAEIALQLQRKARITETLEEAIALSRQIVPQKAILITGSIFVAAAAEEIINSQSQDKS